MENPYDGSYHQGIAHMRMQVGQEEGMETMHEQGNVEDANVGLLSPNQKGLYEAGGQYGTQTQGSADLVQCSVHGRE